MKKSILIFIFIIAADAQYSPFHGSFYYSLDFAPGIMTGDIKKAENVEKNTLNLHIFENGEWQPFTYEYNIANVRLNLGYFLNNKFMLGFNGEFYTLYQSISGTDYKGAVLNQGNAGFILGVMLWEISRIQIFPNLSVNYSFGVITRMASSENGTFNTAAINDRVQYMNKLKNTNGFSSDLSIRFMVFPFSGRFFGYFSPKIAYSYLHYEKDLTGSYPNNLNTFNYTLQLGFGYITE